MINVILRFSALGDIVLTSAFVRSLEGEVIYVTNEQFKKFIEEFMPHHHIKAYGVQKPKGLIGWFREGLVFSNFLSNLVGASKNEDIHIYDLHNVGKSTVFLWGTKWGLKTQSLINNIKYYTTAKYRIERWLRIYFKIENAKLKSLPTYKRHLELLDSPQNNDPSLLHEKSTAPFVQGDRQLHILISPDAQHHKKRWPESHWNEVLSQLSKITSIDLKIKIVGHHRRVENFQKYFEGTRHQVEDLQGKTKVNELPPIAASAQICLCSNSAWLHICESVGTPVVALAGPIVEEFGFSPWRRESKELSVKLKCRPCTLHGDGVCWNFQNPLACIKSFSAQDMLSQMWQSLGYRSAPE